MVENTTEAEKLITWVIINCSDEIPTAKEVFDTLALQGIFTIALCSTFTFTTILLYAEVIVFVFKHYNSHYRRKKTLLLLAVYPVFSFSSLLGVLVPRSGTLVDLAESVYLSTCMYHFVGLVIEYMEGPRNMMKRLEGRPVPLNSPPIACCCPCLPKVKFSRTVFRNLYILALQVAVIRPLVLFIASVLWTNGNFKPGEIDATEPFIYVQVIGIVCTLVAMYSLVVFCRTTKEDLKEQQLNFKLLSLQLVLVISSLQNLICSILVRSGAIPCMPLLSSRARGERLYHILITLEMLPLFLFARHFYRRRSSDESDDADYDIGEDAANTFNRMPRDSLARTSAEIESALPLKKKKVPTATLR